MSSRLVRLLAATAVIAAAVLLGASMLVPPASRRAVALGVAMAAGWQALVFSVTATALGGHRLAAFGVGMLARLLLVGMAAVAVQLLEVPPAPALLSMVTVLFATTLIEPVLFGAGAGNDRDR